MLNYLKINDHVNLHYSSIIFICKKKDRDSFEIHLQKSFSKETDLFIKNKINYITSLLQNYQVDTNINNNTLYINFYNIDNKYIEVPYSLAMQCLHRLTDSEKGKKLKF